MSEAAVGFHDPGHRARISWMFFDWAGQPFYTVITTFVFAPYFAAQVASDPVAGQSQWGFASAAAGLLIALLSPILGAIADATGRRKVWLAGFSAIFVTGSCLLWVAAPQGEASIVLVLFAFAAATVGIEFATVFNNAMLPDIAPRHLIGRTSGSAWAFGYVGGIVALVLVLGFLTTMPGSDLTLIGTVSPVAAIAPGAAERLTGPLSAIWYVVFVTPLFLFCPDVPARSALGPAIRSGLHVLGETLRNLRRHGTILRFLIARMLYQDGLSALGLFGGIYASTVFGWATIEVGIFGILLVTAGALGAWLGGRADDRYGPKTVVGVSVGALTLIAFGLLSIERDAILFVVPAEPGGDGLFASTAERFCLLLGALLGVFFGPAQAASRTILVKLAPHENITEFFGLYALTGKLTAFLAPLSVALVTAISGSQRIGISAIVVFLLTGLALLQTVRVED